MDQHGTPDPLAPAFSPAPDPLPLPTAVTGVGRFGGGDGNRKAIVGTAIAVAVAAFLLAAVGLTVYLFASAGGGVPSSVSDGLRQRAQKQYPGFTVVGVSSRRGATSASDASPVVRVFVALHHTAHPGFVYYATYSAPVAAVGDVNAYDNLDDFFTASDPAQPVESFVGMWLRDHPGEQCDFVFETGLTTDDPRHYEVGYTRSERDNGAVKTVQASYYYAYSAATGSWAQTSSAPVAVGIEPGGVTSGLGTGTADPEADGLTPGSRYPDGYDWYAANIRDDDSLVDTAAAVAEALPAFAYEATATDAAGDLEVVLRHRKLKKVRLALYPMYLDPTDRSDQASILFGGNTKRAGAFLDLWATRHPGKIIDWIFIDPDETGDTNLVDLTFVGSLAAVGDSSKATWVRFRYDPKRHTWKSLPYPED